MTYGDSNVVLPSVPHGRFGPETDLSRGLLLGRYLGKRVPVITANGFALSSQRAKRDRMRRRSRSEVKSHSLIRGPHGLEADGG